MNKKTIVVTGSNSGIGKATALELAKKGHHIIMVCRSESRGKIAQEEIIKNSRNNNIDLMICDFSALEAIRDFGKRFQEKYDKIDVLINNAGTIFGTKELTVDGYERTFAVNHLGYFVVTHYLLKPLKNSVKARIINVSSEAHRIAKIDFDNLQAEKSFEQMRTYGLSKLCNIWFTKQLANILKEDNITVNCLHPGVVGSNFGTKTGSIWLKMLFPIGRFFMISPKKGAATSIHLATSPKVTNFTGEYFKNCQKARTTKAASNLVFAKKLWDISLKLTDIKEYGE